jgi:hypothetical protein
LVPVLFISKVSFQKLCLILHCTDKSRFFEALFVKFDSLDDMMAYYASHQEVLYVLSFISQHCRFLKV